MLFGSASVDIYTKSSPVILEFDENCHHAFDYFIDSLFYGFDLHITADGDYQPLSYSFDAQLASDDTIYLHSYSQTVPKLLDIILPIHCDFTLIGTAIDAQNTKTSETIDCCISVIHSDDDENDCFSYKTEVVAAYFADKNADGLLSIWQMNRYIFQTAFNVLHYLHTMQDTECIFNHFQEVLDVLSTYYNSADSDFCVTSNNYLFAIQLTQTVNKWLSIGLQNDGFFSDLLSGYTDYFALIFDLWTQALDPCKVIRNVIVSTDDLSVSQQSVITNKIIVVHQDMDITNELSILLTDTHYFDLLFRSIDIFVAFLEEYLTNIMAETESSVSINKVGVFVQKVMHIAGLSSISRAIPTEFAHIKWSNFELYSIRNDTSFIDIIVNDVEVRLEDDDNNGVKDVVIFGISSNAQSDVAYVGDNIDCLAHSQGEMDGNEVSVTIVNASSSETNVTMVFKHDFDADDDGIACVWWNEIENRWESSGCQSEMDYANGLVLCHCTHLTTFATISHLHNECKSSLFERNRLSFILLIFAAAFQIIFGWIVYILIKLKLFRSKIFQHSTTKIIAFVACIAFIESMACVLFYLYTEHSAYVITYSVLIMIPLVLYYFMFTLIINSWIAVAYATGEARGIDYFRKILQYSAVAIAALFVAVFILFITFNRTLIMVAEITWCLAMTLCVVLLPYYGNRVIRLLAIYALRQSDAHKRSRLMATRTRLKMTIITFCIFFMVQCALTIYLSINKELHTIYWTLFDLSVHLLCLCVICYLYKGKLYKLMSKKRISTTRKRLPATTPTSSAMTKRLDDAERVGSESTMQSEFRTPGTTPEPRATISTYTHPMPMMPTLTTRVTQDSVTFDSMAAASDIRRAASHKPPSTTPYMERVRSATMDSDEKEAPISILTPGNVSTDDFNINYRITVTQHHLNKGEIELSSQL